MDIKNKDMKNAIKKNLLVLVSCLMASMMYGQTYSHVGVSAGTINIYSATNPGAGSKFYKYTDGAYMWRASSGHSFSTSNGIKTQGSQSGVVFYMAESFHVTTTVTFEASKNFENVTAYLYTISAEDYDKFFKGTDNNTQVTFTKTDYANKTIVITAKGEVSETFESLPAGYYFVVCSGSASNTYFKKLTFESAGTPTPVISTDATLQSIVYGSDQTSVPGFAADKLSYDVELPANYVGAAPTVVATPTDSKANVDVTQAMSVPGTATIVVTAEDGTTKKTYTVNFTRESAAPKVESVTWTNIKGSAAVDNVNLTITGEVAHGSSLTLTPSFTGKNIASWTPTDAQDFSTGAINYTFTSSTSETTTYAVTITEEQLVAVTGISLNKTTANLQVGGTETLTATVTPANASDKSLNWTSDNSAVATVTNGVVTAVAAGSAVITATSVSDPTVTATCTVTVTDGPPVPATDLTTHMPEIYEAKEMEGGYATPLVAKNGREYEVYYITRDAESKFCIATTNTDKTEGITTRSSDFACTAKDGWFKMSGTGWSSATDAPGSEFETMARRLDMDNSCEFSMHIKGFDQFALVARDKKKDDSGSKPENNRYLEVYVDDVLQPQQFSTDPSLRRYDISTKEHVVRVKHIGSEKSAMYAFSLRVAQEPRVKKLKGNDTTQVVYQAMAPKAISYFVKYASMGETKLVWSDQEGTGFTLTKAGGNELGDTLVFGGKALCPTGLYPFRVVTYMNGIETSSLDGKLTVASELMVMTDTTVVCYQGEAMDEIKFTYHALSADNLTLTWLDQTPMGISGSGQDGFYTISGTPTSVGTFPFALNVAGGNTITGKVTVNKLDLGNDPIMYLYKSYDYEQDPIFQYLTGKGKNLIARKTKEELRPADQYAKYKWIIISEDADANNPEVQAVALGQANLPVLNMNAFTYANIINEAFPKGWGEPNNGTVDTVTNNGQYIYVQRDDHPIFKSLNKKTGDKIRIIEKMAKNGVMPIAVNMPNTFCLATAYTRNINDYWKDGEKQTILHEIPAGMRGGKKYIGFPIKRNVTLTSDGKALLDAIVTYLTDDSQSSLMQPDLRITAFTVEGYTGEIDEAASTITLSIEEKAYEELDSLRNTAATITLADAKYSFVTPASGDSVSLLYSSFIPTVYVVSDYINRRVYNVSVVTYIQQGIDEVYSAGQWVNIYDIYGRLVATTNEDIHTMALPHGMYIVVTENGKSVKLMR